MILAAAIEMSFDTNYSLPPDDVASAYSILSIPPVIPSSARRTYTSRVYQNWMAEPMGCKLVASLVLCPQWIMHMLLQTAAQSMRRPGI